MLSIFFLNLYCAHIPVPWHASLKKTPRLGLLAFLLTLSPASSPGLLEQERQVVDTQGPGLLAWLRPAKPPEPAGVLTRAERPLGSPLAFLLTTPDGVPSSSVGDFVRGGTMPTAGRQSSQWASWREEGGVTGRGCFSERLGLTPHLPWRRQAGWVSTP